MIARARAAAAREEGRALLLGIGLIVLVLGLVLVVASATAVHLDLKRLTALADSAADAAEPGAYYEGDGGALPGLTGAGARAAAQADLGRQPAAGGLEGVQIAEVEVVDSTTVVVTLSARSRPPFLPWGAIPSRGFIIRASGSARTLVAP